MISKSTKKVVITVGKPDGNKDIHFGHLSGGIICADAYARFLRKELGESNVLFISGTECYGSSIPAGLASKNLPLSSAGTYVIETHIRQAQVLQQCQVSFDHFFCDAYDSTLHQTHLNLCQMFVDSLLLNQVLIPKQERILVDSNGIFLNYRQILSNSSQSETVPDRKRIYSETDSRQLLGKASGASLEERFVTNYFIDGRKWEEKIRTLIHTKYASHKKQLNSILAEKADLDPLFRLTGNSNWGIDVILGGQSKHLWVWIDSLLAPISYTIRLEDSLEKALEWWGSGTSAVIHFMAEDNIKFYGILENILISSWNDYYENKINHPHLYLTPMRTVFQGDYHGPFPTGQLLLEYYSAEQIRYCLFAMGPHTASFKPTRLSTKTTEPDDVSSRCDSMMRKINRLVRNARRLLDIHHTELPHSDVIELGDQIYSQYSYEMHQLHFNRVIDVIEANIQQALQSQNNAIFFARLFLHMLYPILPDYTVSVYHSLFKDEKIFDKYVSYNS